MLSWLHQSISVPSGSTVTIPGRNQSWQRKVIYARKAGHNNFPLGIVVNQTFVTPYVRQVSVVLINTIERNLRI